MYYPREVVDEVLANTDIVDVVSAHVRLKKTGNRYVGLCPFHSEKTPSFNVIPAKNMYYCFGCGAAGSALTFLMKYNNSSFPEALRDLADRAGIRLPERTMDEESVKRERHRQELLAVNREAAVYYYRLLRSERGARGLRYFEQRGLSPEIMKTFGLGFADEYGSALTAFLRNKGFSDELILESDLAVFNEKQGVHDRFWNRVMFPIQDARGRVIGFGGRVLGDGKPKYINSSDTQIFDKGRNLYALNLARRSRKEHLILCEGYLDVIAMHQAGFTEAVASLGTAFTPGQAALIKRQVGKVLLAYDSDGAGVRAALRNIAILRGAGLESSVIDLRPHKDPDEFIRAEGKEAFQERIEKAQNSFFYELTTLENKYRMEDPAERTAFHREIARKLCSFSDEVERDNYIAAAAEKYFIREDVLRRLVAQYGVVLPEREKEGGGSMAAAPPARGPHADKGIAGSIMADKGMERISAAEEPLKKTKAGRALIQRQSLLLSWLFEEPEVFSQVKKVLRPEDFSGEFFVKLAQLLWKQAGENEGPVRADSVISAFDTSREQEAAASILGRSPCAAGEDGEGAEQDRDREKMLRELVYAVKEEAVRRMTDGPGGGAPLGELLNAKQELLAVRSMRFHV